MTGRIDTVFSKLKADGRSAVVPYICCGDPYADATVDVMLALAEGGADVIELGVPFSDPMADGPVIQKASERALARGIGTPQVLEAVRAFRVRDAATPVVLMGYANPVEAYDLAHGKGAFVRAAAEAGVDGVLVVDYPPEESLEFSRALKAAGLAPIFLLAPTSTEKRMKQVAEVAAGYVYYVSLKGVTGAGHLDTDAVARAVPRIKEHVKVPVGVGFGIRDAASAKAVALVSDAVVIGSALVQCLEALPRDQVADGARRFIAGIRSAVDEIRKA
ncbi:MAG TPA: tryptophan synthase subunit alpha [Burkholderiaceae bacterium]